MALETLGLFMFTRSLFASSLDWTKAIAKPAKVPRPSTMSTMVVVVKWCSSSGPMWPLLLLLGRVSVAGLEIDWTAKVAGTGRLLVARVVLNDDTRAEGSVLLTAELILLALSLLDAVILTCTSIPISHQQSVKTAQGSLHSELTIGQTTKYNGRRISH